MSLKLAVAGTLLHLWTVHSATLLHAQVVTREAQFTARCSRTYANAHTYHINSISMSSDRETFLSADDLRINLWHLDISSCSFNILDIKPAKMEDLTEVLQPIAEHPYSRSTV